MKNLTCILTLKGREKFSTRFFEYIRTINLPYKLIIGDGDPASAVEKSLIPEAKIDTIDYEYLSFNDVSPQKFFYKLETLIEHAQTPYVMLCDNDDFLILSGIEKSIKFLDQNLDYMSCGGRILGFDAIVNKKDEMHILKEGWIYGDFFNCNSSSPLQRVLSYIENYTAPCWYNVYRKDALLKSIKLFRETGVNDFLLMELFMAFSVSAQGKQHIDHRFVNYVRQKNSSQTNASIKNFMHRVIYDNLGNDIKIIIDALSHQIQDVEKTDFKNTREKIRAAFLAYFDKKTNDPFMSKAYAFLRNFYHRWDYTLRYIFSPYNTFKLSHELKNIKKELVKKGVSKSEIDLFVKEYQEVRHVIVNHPNCR